MPDFNFFLRWFCCIDQAGLKPNDLPTSASPVLTLLGIFSMFPKQVIQMFYNINENVAKLVSFQWHACKWDFISPWVEDATFSLTMDKRGWNMHFKTQCISCFCIENGWIWPMGGTGKATKAQGQFTLRCLPCQMVPSWLHSISEMTLFGAAFCT